MATYTWSNGSGGLWDTTGDWTPTALPGSADLALINQTGSYAVTIQPSDTIVIGSLTLNDSAATLVVDGVLGVTGTVAVAAGTLAVQGDLSAGALTDSALLAFVGSQTVAGLPISIGNGGVLQVWDPSPSTPAALIFGSSETVTVTGSSATLGSTLLNQESIVNEGTIVGAVSGGSLRIVPLDFTNSGVLSVTNEALTIGYDDTHIGGVRGPWSNTGTIALAGTASLKLDGLVTTGGLGRITGANGVSVAGVLDNSNATLVVGTGTLGPVTLLNAGVISGGTIVDAGGGLLSAGNDALNSVTYEGTLELNGETELININGSLGMVGAGGVGQGTILVAGGDQSELNFNGNQTLDNAVVLLDSSNSFSSQVGIENSGTLDTTLTLGQNVTVSSTVAGTQAYLDNAYEQDTVLVNDGSIAAAAAGGGFSIDLTEGFTNNGSISVSNGDDLTINPGFASFVNASSAAVSVGSGSMLTLSNGGISPQTSNLGSITLANASTLELNGYWTPAALGAMVNQGATTVVDGTYDDGGGTLTLGGGSMLGTVLLGSQIRNATIVPNGALTVIAGGNASLQNDTYQGPIAIATDYTRLTFDQVVAITDAAGTGAGMVTLSGQEDTLELTGAAIDNVTIAFGNALTADELIPAPPSQTTVTFGPHVTIESTTPGALANFAPGYGAIDDLQGTIIATAHDGTFIISGVTSGYAPFNTTFYNDGTIVVGNSDLLKLTTAIVTGSTQGIIEIGSGGTFDVGAGVAADQNVAVTGPGTLLLRQPSSFAASVTSFGVGGTIDLAGLTANSAVWSAGTLTVENAGSAVASVLLPGNYTGVGFTANSDQHGGSNIVRCFAAGTRIRTTCGEVAVETLVEGDVVETALDGSAAPIVWIGRRAVDCVRHPKPQAVWPVRIRGGAFGPGMPVRELALSPDHAVYVNAVLIPVKYLVNGSTIVQVPVDQVTYYHLELARHDVLFAEGLPAETYLDVGDRTRFADNGRVLRLFPDFATPAFDVATIWEAMGCAPLVVSGSRLAAARALVEEVAHAASAGQSGEGGKARGFAPGPHQRALPSGLPPRAAALGTLSLAGVRAGDALGWLAPRRSYRRPPM